MSWQDAQAALLLLSEERVGSAMRAAGQAEDAAFAAAKDALGRMN